MKLRKRQISLLLLPLFFQCFFPLGLFSQKFSYTQYHQDYLSPFQSAEAITQDNLGYIWIGGQEGLYRFDGKHFHNYNASFKSRHIYAFSQHLFVSDGGLFSIHNTPKTEVKRIWRSSIEENDTTLYYPNNLMLDAIGNCWISQSNNRIVRYKDGQLTKFLLSETKEMAKTNFQEDQWSNIWALSSIGGLYRFDEEQEDFIKKHDFSTATALYISDNLLWVGGADLRVFRITNKGRLTLLKRWNTDDHTIQSITQDQTEVYWIGIEKTGLFILSNEEEQLQKVFGSNDPHRIDELDLGTIHCIYSTADSISKRGAVWVATSSGLWLLQGKYFESINNLPRSAATDLTVGNNQSVWITFGDLFHAKKEGNDFNAIHFNYDVQINATLYDSNKLWVTTSDYHILVLQNRVLQQRYDLSERGEGIFYLYKDSGENLWFCQAPSQQPIVGVARITPSQKIEIYDENKGFESRVLVVKESSRGELYAAGIGETTYLYQYDAAMDQFINISLPMNFRPARNFEIHDMAIDARGVVWLASTDGLLMYDSEKIQRINIPPLLEEEVRGVCTTDDGSIWAATATKGLVYYKHGRYVVFNESSGLPSTINAYRCLKKDAENRIWAGTAEGVVYSSSQNTTPPISVMPAIEKVMVNKKNIKLIEEEKLFAHDNARIEVNYLSLAYPGDQILYQHRIINAEEAAFIGADQFWSKPSDETTFSINDLELGNHLFQIRARQSGGYQWSPVHSILVEIHQVWYKKWWLIAAVVGGVLFLFGGYIRLFLLYRVRDLEKILNRQKKELAAKVSVIEQQSETLDHQKEELSEAMSNIATLHFIAGQIKPNSQWDEIIASVGKAIDQSIGIHAFEIAYRKEDDIKYRGYSNQEQGGLTYRKKIFNPKTSLTSYVIAYQKEIVINDFRKEHSQYVKKKASYHFQSMIFIPFQLANGQQAVLCVYHTKKDQFERHDVLMLEVLADYLCLCAVNELE